MLVSCYLLLTKIITIKSEDPKYVSSIQDIYNNRSDLKHLPYNEYVVNYLVDFVLEGIQQGKRFRKLECLKVIRGIIKDQNEPALQAKTVSKLFTVYKNYIFHYNDEIKWCVSSFLRGRVISDFELQWIIDNYKESEHLVNRLLRYPKHHPLLEEWSRSVYLNGELEDNRKSEVIALLIKEEVPEIVKSEHFIILVWAIYFARVPESVKSTLLEQLFLNEKLNSFMLKSFIEICNRLGLESVLKRVLDKLYTGSSRLSK